MAARRLLRRIAVGFAAILLAYLLVVIGARLWPLSAEDRAAVALMDRAPPPVAGRDGSDAAWLQDHDVPEAEHEAVARQVREFYQARANDPDAFLASVPALARYPKFDGIVPLDGACGASSDCLDDVRKDPERVGAYLSSHARRVAVGMQMARFDGVRYGVPPGPGNPLMPVAHNAQVLRLFRAHEFVAGRRQAAIGGVCADLAGWRRISGDVDTLIGNVVSLAMVRQDAVLLAAMMAELPAGESLPGDCAAALAPTRDAELDSCLAFRSEYRFVRKAMDAASDGQAWYQGLAFVTIDRQHRDSVLARRMSSLCGATALADTRADRSALPRVKAALASCSAFRVAVDPVGCVMLEFMPTEELAKYADRRADVAAIVAGVRAAAWLREQQAPAGERARLVANRPASLGLLRAPRIAQDGRAMAIPLLSPWQGTEAVLRLPPSP